MQQPGKSSAGQHWMYRYDGHRKCWYQVAEDTAAARKPVRHRTARRSVTAPEQDASAPRKQEDVADARAEMTSSAPAQTPQPAPAPKVTMVRTVPVRDADAAALVPQPPVLDKPVLDKPGADQLAPDQPAPRRVDVEQLLAEAPAASSEIASAPPTPVAAPGANTGDGEHWMTPWLGMLLMVLGGAALLASSPTLRRALSPARFWNARTELRDDAYDGRSDPSFAQRVRSADARRDQRPGYDPQGGAAPVHAVRTRRTEAPAEPSQQSPWDEGIGALAALASPVSPEALPARRATAYRGE